MSDVAVQIAASQKAQQKLPQWTHSQGIIYASALSMEQCSSEKTARYKASLVSGNLLLDLTGGMGVDTFYMSQNFMQAIHIEAQTQLSEITAHNFAVLGAQNIRCENTEAFQFLQENPETIADFIFLDPARRDEHKKKVFLLEDCQPNVRDLLPYLQKNAKRWLLKLSPMLDIKQALSQLPPVREVHIVAVENECKELLFLIDNTLQEIPAEPKMVASNLKGESVQTFAFYSSEEKSAICAFAEETVGAYLYEPNAALLKAGAFKSIAQKFGLKKLHPDSHLYCSEDLVTDFYGRIFKVENVLPYQPKLLAQQIPDGKANISVRNFPDTVAQIRTRTKLKDGGDTYIFGTTTYAGKHVLLCCKKV